MSIASTPFLFLFLPLAIGIYFLLPQSKNLLFRNLFLVFISLFFYACGEPVFILPFLVLIVLTWLLGKMASGRQNTKIGKTAVFLTAAINIGTLWTLGKLKLTADILGLTPDPNNAFFMAAVPLGLSFFAFHSISYVVDIYRGQCKAAPKFLDAVLYLSVFFKIQQGPIIAYHQFEPQIKRRTTTADDFSGGIWRVAIGLAKKMIIAGNLAYVTKIIFASDFSTLSLSDAWLGCGVFMIVLYYDFSGYSDMAIGLAKIFGFTMPENFNYPYVSTSIGEYWRRWHITLCAWFRDYLYYPIVLGPAVQFRKFLRRHHISDQTARTMQSIFAPTCVWIITGLWHGTNWNYTLWGLANSGAMIVEPHMKPLKNRRLNTFVRWLGTMLLLILMVPLMCSDSLRHAGLYFKAMFAGNGIYAVSDAVRYNLEVYRIFLVIGAAGSFMFFPWIKRKLYPKKSPYFQAAWQWGEALFLMACVIISLGYLLRTGSVTFLYQQ